MVGLMQVLQMTWVFLRVGTLVFGGGMVMIPLLQQDVVVNHQWLTQQEFVDAVALGQMTPGPLLVTATFIGYKVAGVPGATIATIAIFLPSLLMTVLLARQLARIRNNVYVRGFLKGVNVAIVGLILAAALSVAQVAFKAGEAQYAISLPSFAYRLDPYALAIAIAGTVAMLRYKVEATYVIVAAAIIGLALYH